MSATCETCRWWHMYPKSMPRHGECWRYPQTVGKEYWKTCGEHQPKEQP